MGAVASNSARPAPLRLPLLTIGFCTDLAGEEKLRAAGVERIWRRGDGDLDLDDALYEFRGRAGALAIVGTMRIFGDTRKAINKRSAALLRAGIGVVDIEHPEENLPEMLERALASLHASKPMRNHRTARRRGSLGGKAKAAMAELARAIRIHPDIARRLWLLTEITQKKKLWVLGEGFTLSSCQRHYA